MNLKNTNCKSVNQLNRERVPDKKSDSVLKLFVLPDSFSTRTLSCFNAYICMLIFWFWSVRISEVYSGSTIWPAICAIYWIPRVKRFTCRDLLAQHEAFWLVYFPKKYRKPLLSAWMTKKKHRISTTTWIFWSQKLRYCFSLHRINGRCIMKQSNRKISFCGPRF